MSTREVVWGGRKILFTWRPSGNEDDYHPWSQAYGFCFTKEGKLLLVKGKHWMLTGGGREGEETPEETLRREVREEASVTISRIGFLGAMEVHDPDNQTPRNKEESGHHFQLRYAAIIDEIFPMEIDPASGELFERRFIEPHEFPNYIDWGAHGPMMIKAAIVWFEKNKT